MCSYVDTSVADLLQDDNAGELLFFPFNDHIVQIVKQLFWMCQFYSKYIVHIWSSFMLSHM